MPREMKDSGIEWIGEIPSHWETNRLQWHLEEVKVSNSPIQSEQVLSLTIEAGVIPYEEKGNQGNKSKEHYEEYKLAYPNTLVVNSMNVIIGAVGISKHFGCVSPVYYVFRTAPSTDLRYIYYLFTNVGFQKEMRKYAKGILEIRLRISAEDMLKRIIPKPSYEEQKAIADFLDDRCADIDYVIAETKATIEEYKKLKQSVITEAVTKGIRGDRPMKDSGIEWIGEIPREWNVKKLKYTSTFKQNKYQESDGDLTYVGLENIVAWSGKYITTESIYDKEQSLICEPCDILFGKLRPYLAKVYLNTERQCCSGEFSVISIQEQNTKYMWYQLISHGFIFMIDRSTYGTKMPRANADYIKNMSIAAPPLEEQGEIVFYLDQMCAEIDTLIEKKTALLEEMEALKKSIIFEYVTGKKEVC